MVSSAVQPPANGHMRGQRCGYLLLVLGEHDMQRYEHMLSDVDQKLGLLKLLEKQAFGGADLDDGLLGERGQVLLHDKDGALHLFLIHAVHVPDTHATSKPRRTL
eukprot:scaffold4543_cov126-Isochrysis_galbana.AAC.4